MQDKQERTGACRDHCPSDQCCRFPTFTLLHPLCCVHCYCFFTIFHFSSEDHSSFLWSSEFVSAMEKEENRDDSFVDGVVFGDTRHHVACC